eukprot:1512955-Alexandrium_andersonii.AAC.1
MRSPCMASSSSELLEPKRLLRSALSAPYGMRRACIVAWLPLLAEVADVADAMGTACGVELPGARAWGCLLYTSDAADDM